MFKEKIKNVCLLLVCVSVLFSFVGCVPHKPPPPAERHDHKENVRERKQEHREDAQERREDHKEDARDHRYN